MISTLNFQVGSDRFQNTKAPTFCQKALGLSANASENQASVSGGAIDARISNRVREIHFTLGIGLLQLGPHVRDGEGAPVILPWGALSQVTLHQLLGKARRLYRHLHVNCFSRRDAKNQLVSGGVLLSEELATALRFLELHPDLALTLIDGFSGPDDEVHAWTLRRAVV